MKLIREYEISYITKEHLSKNGWRIIAFNPPGSQGTFTIPNPEKNPNYRGQDGSESPDIVAFKEKDEINYLLIVECKPTYDKNDIKKLKELFASNKRKEVFLQIIYKQCLANEIKFDLKKESKIIFGKAHSGDKHSIPNIVTFSITIKNEKWNPECFNSQEKVIDYFDVEEINSFEI